MKPIYQFEQISDHLACSGQPTEEQFKDFVAGKFDVVINLGLLDTKYALENEKKLILSLGMEYHHIPVVFEDPQLNELLLFIAHMNQNAGKKILVHCAANYRASAFLGLYLFAKENLLEEDLDDFVEDVWQPNTIWKKFIVDGIAHIKSQKKQN